MEQQERKFQPISSQEHHDTIPPMFSHKINWSEGFPNNIMVLSTEYSEAVNARYMFQPLWVSGSFQYGPQSWSIWNLEMLVLEERGKRENPEKNLSE